MIPVFAADSTGGNAGNSTDTVDLSYDEFYTEYYVNGKDYGKVDTELGNDFTPVDFSTEEKRLLAMGKPYHTYGEFELYVDSITGEVAVKDNKTGDIMFTNPVNIAGTQYSSDTKKELLSQVSIQYNDNGQERTYHSFTNSALLGQIKIKRLNGGIRIEYSIGEEESRTLVPRLIEKSRFEEQILAVMENALEGGKLNNKYLRLRSFYVDWDPTGKTGNELQIIQSKYPVTKTGMAVYAFDENAALREVKLIESYIKENCPDYTYEQLDYDHKLTEYEGTNDAPANFKMALEYSLNESGLEVRFPANGLRFDESSYQLTSISILMYMGAGTNDYNGYSMIPDGSGTLIRYEDVKTPLRLTGRIYGQDYAYQTISNQNQEVYRMPVFGLVNTADVRDGVTVDEGSQKTYDSGYLAIVTEGEALTQISAHNGANVTDNMNSCFCTFDPRPKDSYNLAEAISIGSNTTYTVVSDRKYTGSYRIQYIMLTDPDNPVSRTGTGRTYYETSYVGMAKAYRDYLEGKGSITQLTEKDVDVNNIPFYIESFGVTETDETVMSIPVTVKKALTSFADLETIAENLKAANITNINFRLVGFTNGGMVSTVPSKVKFEKAVGGNDDYRDFLQYAQDNGFGVYPDFDFAYMSDVSSFDGFSYKKDAVKTIDNRYITKRTYDAVLQTFTATGKICISPSVYDKFFDKFTESLNKVLKGSTTGISIGTLGSDLNSDFDEDAPYNREDSKVFTVEMLKQMQGYASGGILTDAGNAYAIPYSNIVLNASLDSSRYFKTSEAIPFFGMVYHSYIVFAGSPTNMAGDLDYEILKIIENGATLYMLLSYQNVELLKEDVDLSKYYAISYEIWEKSLIGEKDENGAVITEGVYAKLNKALADVQTYAIDDHRFLAGKRVLSKQEEERIHLDATAAYEAEKARLTALWDNAKAKRADFDKLVALYGTDKNGLDNAVRIYQLGASSTGLAQKLDEAIVEAKNALDACVAEGITPYKNVELEKIENQKLTYIDDGSIVYVRYENGHWFVLNYNDFEVAVVSPEDGITTVTVGAKDYFDSNSAA